MATPTQSISACVCGKTDCPIPFGICHCGCARTVRLASTSNSRLGRKKGQPSRFSAGHATVQLRIDFSDALPFKIEGVYCKLIQLTRGQFAVVDAADHDWLSLWIWCASWNKRAQTYYVYSAEVKEGKRRRVVMHRKILGLESGDRRQGDHKSGIGLDNRRLNLRRATNGQNMMNSRIRKSSSTGFKGVTESNGRFVVHLRGKWLGSRKTAEEGHKLYCAAAVKEFGEFARMR
jgi:hypothetical protein